MLKGTRVHWTNSERLKPARTNWYIQDFYISFKVKVSGIGSSQIFSPLAIDLLTATVEIPSRRPIEAMLSPLSRTAQKERKLRAVANRLYVPDCQTSWTSISNNYVTF